MEKYQVWFNPCFGSDGVFEKEFETQQEAELALEVIADYTLMLHECSLMEDHSNCGMVLGWDGDEWIEIDGDGNEL